MKRNFPAAANGFGLLLCACLLAGCGGEKTAPPTAAATASPVPKPMVPTNAARATNLLAAEAPPAVTNQLPTRVVVAESPAKHEHRPPHGGTPIALGNEEYHLELVLDVAKTKLVAYVLDGELEKFIRITAPSFVIAVVVEGRDEVLTFEAVASNATGETVGDTSMFEVRADWLKADTTFDGILEELPVRSSKYSRVSFKFPKGNDAKP